MNRKQMEQEVARLAEAWATAELQHKTAFLEKRFSDDFVGLLEFLLAMQQWLARHQTGDLKNTARTLDEIKVRLDNEAAS